MIPTHLHHHTSPKSTGDNRIVSEAEDAVTVYPPTPAFCGSIWTFQLPSWRTVVLVCRSCCAESMHRARQSIVITQGAVISTGVASFLGG